MKEKLESLCRRFDEQTARMSDPSIYDDMVAYKKLTKEVAQLEPIVKTWRRLEAINDEQAEAQFMLDDTDEELKELAKEELKILNCEQEKLEAELQVLLLPRDPDDDKDVILEIRAGAGGEEAALFAADLYRMYARFAEKQKW